jgi:hypothetical protein
VSQPPMMTEDERRDFERAHDRLNEFLERARETATKGAETLWRTIAWVNGGAAVSVLAFIGGLASQNRIQIRQLDIVAGSLIFFAFGVVAALLALALHSFNNYAIALHANAYIFTYDNAPYYTRKTKRSYRWSIASKALQTAAILSGVTSLALFVYGMINVRQAVARLGETAAAVQNCI